MACKLTIYSTGTEGSLGPSIPPTRNSLGLISGHSWIEIERPDGRKSSLGTYGGHPRHNDKDMLMNSGLRLNIERDRGMANEPGVVSRTVDLTDAQQAVLVGALRNYRNQGERGWDARWNCASFAAYAWQRATGEYLGAQVLEDSPPLPLSLDRTTNPATLKASIIDRNRIDEQARSLLEQRTDRIRDLPIREVHVNGSGAFRGEVLAKTDHFVALKPVTGSNSFAVLPRKAMSRDVQVGERLGVHLTKAGYYEVQAQSRGVSR